MFKGRSPRFTVTLIMTLVIAFFAWRYLIKIASPVPLKGSRVPKPVALTDINIQSTDKFTKLSDFRGKWLLVFFGFTHCPDVCPTSLAYIRDEYHKLLELRPYVRMAFVSVDGERDSTESCSEYVKNFEPNFSCIIADEANLKTFSSELASFHKKEGEGSDYNIAHSGDVYLISPKGEWIAFYRPPFEPGVLQSDLQALIQRNL